MDSECENGIKQIITMYETWARTEERKLLCDDLIRECRYLLNSGMGKKKSLEHLIRILEKGMSNQAETPPCGKEEE